MQVLMLGPTSMAYSLLGPGTAAYNTENIAQAAIKQDIIYSQCLL